MTSRRCTQAPGTPRAHAVGAHGLTAAAYHAEHGLARGIALVASTVREARAPGWGRA
ncbi:hypothetical protein OG216_47245 (plasmid) [Streptomycetaceae bacterium NBC_01309]